MREKKWEEALEKKAAAYVKNKVDTEDSVLIPVFRGINFKRDLFKLEDRFLYEESAYSRFYFASHGCYYLLDKEPHDISVSYKDLEEKSKKITDYIQRLKDPKLLKLFEGNEKELRDCKTFLRRIQMFYTENIDGFNHSFLENLLQDEMLRKNVLEELPYLPKLFATNPFVSGAVVPMHAVRYTLGVSRASANSDLSLAPRYDRNGKPKYPCVGMVIVAFYSKKEYQELEEAIYIPKAIANGEIPSLKAQRELLNEAEITISGMMKHVYITLPIVYPSFEEEHRDEVLKKYGFSEKVYENRANGLREKRDSLPYKNQMRLLNKDLIKYYNQKLLEAADNYAKKNNSKLQFEMPNGGFVDTAPSCDQIRRMAESEREKTNAKKDNKKKILTAQTQKRKETFKGPAAKRLKKMDDDTKTTKDFYLELYNATLLYEKVTSTDVHHSLQTKQRLEIHAKEYGFACEDALGDGNCFYSAIALQLNRLLELRLENEQLRTLANVLRKLACEYIEKNQAFYKDFITSPELELQSKDGTWVDDAVITALCHALNINLVLLRSDDDITIKKYSNSVLTLYLGYQVGLHYQSLRPIETKKNNLKQAKLHKKIDDKDVDIQPQSKIHSREILCGTLKGLLKKSTKIHVGQNLYDKLTKSTAFLGEEEALQEAILASFEISKKPQSPTRCGTSLFANSKVLNKSDVDNRKDTPFSLEKFHKNDERIFGIKKRKIECEFGSKMQEENRDEFLLDGEDEKLSSNEEESNSSELTP